MCAIGNWSGKWWAAGVVYPGSRSCPLIYLVTRNSWEKHRRANYTLVFCLQKDILKSDLIICSVAAILSFAVSASTVFLSLRVCIHVALHSYPLLILCNKRSPLCSSRLLTGWWSQGRYRKGQLRAWRDISRCVTSYVQEELWSTSQSAFVPFLFPQKTERRGLSCLRISWNPPWGQSAVVRQAPDSLLWAEKGGLTVRSETEVTEPKRLSEHNFQSEKQN